MSTPTKQPPASVALLKNVIIMADNEQQQQQQQQQQQRKRRKKDKKKKKKKKIKRKRSLSPSSTTPNKKKKRIRKMVRKRATKIRTPASQEFSRQAATAAIGLAATNFLTQKKNVTDEIKIKHNKQQLLGEQQQNNTPNNNVGSSSNALPDMADEIKHRRPMEEQQNTPNNNAGSSSNALPEMASQYFSFENHDTTPRRRLHQLFLQLTETVMDKFEDHIMAIVPLCNDARMNHQSKQAIRIFFGREGKIINEDVVERYIYGPKAVMTTTGLHPSNYRVYPFTPLLLEIVDQLTKIIKDDLGPEWADFNFDFNFMEIKVYQGKDIFRDENGNPIKDDNNESIRDDNNQSVGLHNDLNINDNGKQSSKDTARGDHPIATYNVGSTRNLVFRWLQKEEIKNDEKEPAKWKVIKNGSRVIELEDGSIFVLLPADETPQAINDVLFKTQHEGKFSHQGATGMSLGFVFRSVKSKSLFHRSTNCWQWDMDKKYQQVVNGSLKGKWGKKHEEFPVSNPKAAKDVNAIKNNVKKFINNLKTLKSL